MIIICKKVDIKIISLPRAIPNQINSKIGMHFRESTEALFANTKNYELVLYTSQNDVHHRDNKIITEKGRMLFHLLSLHQISKYS